MLVGRVLECNIIDNGKGLNAHKQSKFHVSRGIALARERIMLLQPSNEDPILILRRIKVQQLRSDYLFKRVASFGCKTILI
jgi:hypothetical protein